MFPRAPLSCIFPICFLTRDLVTFWCCVGSYVIIGSNSDPAPPTTFDCWLCCFSLSSDSLCYSFLDFLVPLLFSFGLDCELLIFAWLSIQSRFVSFSISVVSPFPPVSSHPFPLNWGSTWRPQPTPSVLRVRILRASVWWNGSTWGRCTVWDLQAYVPFFRTVWALPSVVSLFWKDGWTVFFY
jgi:hypothetical protein